MDRITVENISKSYQGRKVLDGFSCTFAGEGVNMILGSSGRGKTTLMNILAGIEEYEEGSVKGLENACGNMAAVFQENRLCENLTVSANIRMVKGHMSAGEKEKFSEELERLLAAVGMEGTASAAVSSLSGGMKRRVAIIRCVLAGKDVLFFDEALKGLDRETEKKTMENIIPYIKGKTVFWITHRPEEKEYFIQEKINVEITEM